MRHNATSRRGFTLVEVLVALVLIGIVLPTVMEGLNLGGKLADMAHRRTEAAGLAQSELAQIVASGSWQNGSSSGDFSPNWPLYSWQSSVGAWSGDTQGAGLQEIDVTVKWKDRNRDSSVTLSTLAYVRTTQNQTTTGTATP